MGADLTEADIRLFVTLIRFDAAYHGLFKTNLRRIADYPILQTYLNRVLNFPGIAKTVNLEHIKAGYYSIKALNPSGIIPYGPDDVEQMVIDAKQQRAYSSNTLGNHNAISGKAMTMPSPNSCNNTKGTIPA